MEDNAKITKITYAKNLQTLNINTVISTPIDANVNIKKIIDVCTYIYDTKTECGNGKAIINGKLGVKVLYVDTDNITNTLTDTQTFSESYTNSTITNDCILNISDCNISHSILSTEGSLKISLDIVINPICYVNLPMNTNTNFENMIIKKSEIHTNSITQFVNTNFDYTLNFETKENITKILCHNAHYSNTSLTCYDNYAVAEGKLYSTLIFETTENEETKIKQLNDCFNIKTDISLDGLSADCMMDVSFSLDKSRENITTETEDDNNIITIQNKINVVGVCTKNVTIEVVDDLYSVENEIELNLSKRDYTKDVHYYCITDSVINEINLTNEETAIDDVIANLEIASEITNSYIKDETLFIEGIISSNLAYIDENKDYQTKNCEIPFIINTKIALNKLDCVHSTVNVSDCKVKIKRGTIIELEYFVTTNVCVYEQDIKELVDNITIGKSVNFSNYDYQIYLAKPNETMWELCKRIKTTPENINRYNKNLPIEFIGNEKIIIKR